jgi:hypothetical protein
MLILDLHSHLTDEDVCGYLAGHWDPNSHNLAITNTFPCLISRSRHGFLTHKKGRRMTKYGIVFPFFPKVVDMD